MSGWALRADRKALSKVTARLPNAKPVPSSLLFEMMLLIVGSTSKNWFLGAVQDSTCPHSQCPSLSFQKCGLSFLASKGGPADHLRLYQQSICSAPIPTSGLMPTASPRLWRVAAGAAHSLSLSTPWISCQALPVQPTRQKGQKATSGRPDRGLDAHRSSRLSKQHW